MGWIEYKDHLTSSARRKSAVILRLIHIFISKNIILKLIRNYVKIIIRYINFMTKANKTNSLRNPWVLFIEYWKITKWYSAGLLRIIP